MRELLIESLKLRFKSYDDLMAVLDDPKLGEKLEAPKHKTMLEHLWCIVGARESYAKALASGEWQGFACSISQYTHDEISDKLKSSAKTVLDAVDSVTNWTQEREKLLLALSDHEVMHEGGVIRHMYAFEHDIPDSVQWA